MKKKPKKKLTPEQAYVKAICKAQREAIGFQPAVTHRNRKKYRRVDAKRELLAVDK